MADPITLASLGQGLLSMFGFGGGAAAGTAAAAPGITAGASGLGATMGGGATGLSAQMGAGTQLFAPQATAALGASASPAYTDIAIKMGGFDGLKKAGESLLDPNMALHDKFNAAAPELYKQNQQGQATFSQLQQGAQPMQMPSYAQPTMPYQGGGIEEILKRQQGLLR